MMLFGGAAAALIGGRQWLARRRADGDDQGEV